MSTLICTQENKSNTPTATDQKVLAYLDAEQLDYYDAVISEEENFQVWYQLSSLRTGLISWYPFEQNATVLEIGAGFGALTGMLCDKCDSVSATERSLVRAEAIVKRWNQKENLTVYAGEWSEIEFPQKFDYIIITGVMERIGGGSNNKQIYVDYLKKAAKLLNPKGKLLVSVENRYGLRYFCGAVEPHTNRAFDGIRKYMQGTGGYSFSRQELEEIVIGAGFTNHKFYYPLPDYKFPQLIYTDTYLPEKNLKERLIPYYTRKDTLVARELELYDDVVANGVFPFFANSFLVEGCMEEDALSNVLYSAVSTDRGKERAFTTLIVENEKVEKTPVFAEGSANARQLYENISDLAAHEIPVVEHKQMPNGGLELPYITWPTLSNAIKEILPKDTVRFETLVEKLYRYIMASSDEGAENQMLKHLEFAGVERAELEQVNFGPILKKAYMELIPLNCFYDEETDAFLYFDQEFVRDNYPAKYVLFRAIHYIYCFTPNAEQYYPKQKLIEKYHMGQSWKYFEIEENLFLDEVRNHKKYAQFYKWAEIDVKRMLDNSDRLVSEEEVVANYKISDKMKKTWKIELEMFDEVVRICKKYNLKYFLIHGSLLGAVRHKGFIPWDDDLDIAMPRADYDKFLSVAPKELKAPLSLHTAAMETDLFWGSVARIRNEETTGIEVRDLGHEGNLGIWMDILPLDVCTMDDEKMEKKSVKIRHYHRLMQIKTYSKDQERFFDGRPQEVSKPLRVWYHILAAFYSRKKIAQMMDDAMRLYTDEPSEDVAFFTGYYKHRRLSAKDFVDTTELMFEGRKVSVPINYENVLFAMLGKDYMKFPPEEQRKPHHRGIMDPDNSYTLYNELLCDMMKGAKGKSIILFGSGLMFEDYMKQYGDKYRPKFLVDNDSNKWGRNRMGIEIKKPEDILSVPESKRHVIICSFYYREIIPQLEKMGIKDYKVYVQNVDWIIETEEKQGTKK